MMIKKDWLSELFPDLELLAEDQARVTSEYAEQYHLTSEESDKLHMFFSPTRVVEGMTEGEIRILLLLFDLREKDRKATFSRHGIHSDSLVEKIALPEEFLFMLGPMTRERFKTGVWKFLQQVVVHQAQSRVDTH